MRREAIAYQLGEQIFIHGKKRTIRSTPIFAEPVYAINYFSSSEDIGKIVRTCVKAFSEGHEHPSRDDFKGVNDPLIKLAKQKSSKAFFTKVKCVPIIELNGFISFCPTENHGWKNGFKFTVHPNIDLDYSKLSDSDLGKALIQALERSSIV